MKNAIKSILLFVAFAALALVQSCKESDKIEPAATVALDKTTAQDKPGVKVTITATVTAPNGGKVLTIYVGGVENSTIDLAGQTTSTQAFEYTIPANAVVGSIIVVTFQVTDNRNFSSAISSCSITVGSPIVELTGTLSGANLNLVKGTPYLIKGQVFVASGTTLNIAAGTVIKGDKASKGTLVIQPGGKINAVGTVSEPIVFTSAQGLGERDRGDWGGVIILGNAFVNQLAKPAIEGITPSQTFGTVDAAQTDATVGANTEDSGKLKYVRIEYAGIELTPNNETNSLTLGGVGNATEIDFVQTSYGGDDGFEWFGGTVNAKHIVSLSTWDDDLDTDFGWRGSVQWVLVIRNPSYSDQSGSTAFESDNQASATGINFCTSPGGGTGTVPTSPTAGQIAGCTQGVFSNVTVFGPRDVTAIGASGGPRVVTNNYTRAMHIRRRSAIGIFNSVIAGFGGTSPTQQGLQMDDQGTLDNFNVPSIGGAFGNNVLFVPDAAQPVGPSNNSEYGSGVATAAAGAVKTSWETAGLSTVVKPAVGAQWSSTPGTPAGSIDPYAAYGINIGLFFGGNSQATYPSNPNFAVTSGSLTGQSAATLFASGRLGAFFDKTLTYKGAFGDTDWTDGWSDFQPQNKAY